MRSFRTRNVTVDGVDTHFIDEGEGQPIVLIHGGGAGADSRGNWSDIIPFFSPHRRVIALDMLGFGFTGKPDGDFVYSQDARNRHLIGFLETLDLHGAVLVGNSMGGATAIAAAVERPDRVSKLVLMGSAGLVMHLGEAIQSVLKYDFTREGMVRIIRALTSEGYVLDDALVDYRVDLASDPEARRAYAATMKWVHDQGGLYYDPSYVASVRIPTLIVNGKQDKVVSLDLARQFLDLIPRSWGYFIPDCGHWAMIEHPQDFSRTTLAFVEAAH